MISPTSLLAVSGFLGQNYRKVVTSTVLVRVTIAVIKHHDQSNLGGKGFNWLLMLPNHSSLPKEDRTRTQTGRKPGGRNRCRDHGGVLPTDLLY